MPPREVPEHLGWRHHHDAHVAIRIDAGRAQPFPQVQMVRGKRKYHPQRQRLATPPGTEMPPQGGAVADAGGPEWLRQREGVALQVEHEGCEDLARGAPEAEFEGPEHRCRGLHRIEFPIDELLAHRGPAHFPPQLDGQSMAVEVALFPGDQQRRGIRQGQISDP